MLGRGGKLGAGLQGLFASKRGASPAGQQLDVMGIMGSLPIFRNRTMSQKRGRFGSAVAQVAQGMEGGIGQGGEVPPAIAGLGERLAGALFSGKPGRRGGRGLGSLLGKLAQQSGQQVGQQTPTQRTEAQGRQVANRAVGLF